MLLSDESSSDVRSPSPSPVCAAKVAAAKDVRAATKCSQSSTAVKLVVAAKKPSYADELLDVEKQRLEIDRKRLDVEERRLILEERKVALSEKSVELLETLVNFEKIKEHTAATVSQATERPTAFSILENLSKGGL